MVFRPSIDSDLVFVIMPFGGKFDGYYEQLIKPVVGDFGKRARRSDEIYGTGVIVADIWEHIWRAQAVIADVTGKNPNVNYELGLCHALGVPTILVTQSIEDVPFDYRHRRCITYDTALVGWETKLKTDLKLTLEAVFPLQSDGALPWPYDTEAAKNFVSSGQVIGAFDALNAIVTGAQLVADVLAKAYGPNGRRVAVKDEDGDTRSSLNGADIARHLKIGSAMQAVGAETVRRIVSDVERAIGDGTKGAAIVAAKLLELSSTRLRAGIDAKDLVRGVERAVEAATGALQSAARPVKGSQVVQLARTACRTEDIAAAVAEAFEKSGKDGVVTIEREVGRTSATVVVNEGIRLDRGLLLESFINNPESGECVLQRPLILFYERKLSSMKELIPLLEQVARSGKGLLIVAEDVEGEALSTLAVNHERGTLQVCPIRAAGFGDRRRHVLQDLAVVTGGTAITSASGRKLETVAITELGSAEKIVITANETTIIGGHGHEDRVRARAEYLRQELSRTTDPIETAKLQERLAAIAGAVATIIIGGVSEPEAAHRFALARNAMHSVHTGIQHGWLPGGGWAALHATTAVDALETLDSIELEGRQCLVEALLTPLTLLPEKVTENPINIGERRAALEASGIIDPTSIHTKGLEVVWSHIRNIIETGAWNVTAPTAKDTSKSVNSRQRFLEDDEAL
jgi:chaperonin GroEL